jgi:hypothetical protein
VGVNADCIAIYAAFSRTLIALLNASPVQRAGCMRIVMAMVHRI